MITNPYYTKSVHKKFSIEEDKKLIELVSNHGTSDWLLISSKMHGRTCRQCRERWNNHLSPIINNNEFTFEEDRFILRKYFEIGPRWTAIAQLLDGRTDQMIKNRFYLLKRHMQKKPCQTISKHKCTHKKDKQTSLVTDKNTSMENDNVDKRTINIFFEENFSFDENDFEEEFLDMYTVGKQ